MTIPLDTALAVHALTTASTTELVAALETLVARTKALNAVGLGDALSTAAVQLLAEVISEQHTLGGHLSKSMAHARTVERERDVLSDEVDALVNDLERVAAERDEARRETIVLENRAAIRTFERDRARREICEILRTKGARYPAKFTAESRGWSYLYKDADDA